MLMLVAILVRRKTVAKITQNSQIVLYLLWSFNQSEAGKKKICLMKRKIFFIIAKAKLNPSIFHKFGLERSFR